jgi:CBS-domain-containing membrane protein
LTKYFRKMRGQGPLPPRASIQNIAASFLGSLLAIGAVAIITSATKTPLVLGSFGASCVLLFSYPDNPFSQPRNVIGGHFLTSLTGLAYLSALGSSWWSLALALATAVALMHVTRTVHPRIVQKENRHSSGCDPMVVAEHSAEALSALNRVIR